MSTYHVSDRGGFLTVGIGFLLAGGLFVVGGALWALGLMTVNGKSQAESPEDLTLVAVSMAMGSLTAYLGWRYAWRLPYEIRLKPDGTVELVRLAGKTRLQATEIRVIERAVARLGPEGEDSRELRIRHRRGCIPVTYFHEVERFIADVRAMNPRVAVKGSW